MTIPNFQAGQILTAVELNSALSDTASQALSEVQSNPNAFKEPQTFEGAITQVPGAGANNQTPFAQYGDFLSDFIVEGLSIAVPSPASLTATLSTGTAVVLGQRTVVSSISNATNTYAASSDTYVSLSQSGVVTYTAVASGATAPASASDAINILKVVTGPIISPTPTLSAGTSGTLAAGTYQVALVAYDATGYGAVSASESVTVAASGSIGISWVNPLNEISMSIYVTAEGGTTLGLVESGVTGTSYTYTGSVAPGAAAPSGATSNAVQVVDNVLPIDGISMGSGNLIGYRLNISGGVQQTLQHRLQQVVSIIDFGADPTGTIDSTTAIQNALNSGVANIFIPNGTFNFSEIYLPQTNGLTLFGAGLGSTLIQTGGGIKWITNPLGVEGGMPRLHDFQLDGTNGTGHSIDTAGVGAVDVRAIHINNVPTGFCGINVDGINGVYTHDIRLTDIRIDSSTAGLAGIRFGPTSSDSLVINYIANLGFSVDYGILFEAGSATVMVSNSHPYNAKINVVNITGTSSEWQPIRFVNCTLDNAQNGDIVSISDAIAIKFIGCLFEAVNSGYNGVTLSNCSECTFIDVDCYPQAGANSAFNETNGSDGNLVIFGNLAYISRFTTPYNLSGPNSMVRFTGTVNQFGTTLQLSSCSQFSIGSGTTEYLGANGASSVYDYTAYFFQYSCTITGCSLACTNLPGSGESFTVSLNIDGTTVSLGTITTSYTLLLSELNITVAANTQFSLQIVTSSGAASSSFRSALVITY